MEGSHTQNRTSLELEQKLIQRLSQNRERCETEAIKANTKGEGEGVLATGA